MKKIEFSKALTLAAVITMLGVAIWSIVRYYQLTELAIQNCASVLPDSAIPIASISTILGAILSYCLYQFGLKNSRNKYGVDSDGNPYKEKVEYEEATEQLCTTPEQTPVDCEYTE